MYQHNVHMRFYPTLLVVDIVEIPLGEASDESVAVVANEDIKLPPRTVVPGRLATGRREMKGIVHLTLMVCSPGEDKVVLCEAVVERAEVVSIMLANQDNKIIKITKRKEVGKALQLRSIQQVKFNREEKNIPHRTREVRDKDIVAP